MKVYQQIQSIRPSISVPFYQISPELEAWQNSGHGMEIFVEKRISYSDDQLTETVMVIYPSQEQHDIVVANEIIRNTRQDRNRYCRDNGITVLRSALSSLDLL